jgi:hypothetical protein
MERPQEHYIIWCLYRLAGGGCRYGRQSCKSAVHSAERINREGGEARRSAGAFSNAHLDENSAMALVTDASALEMLGRIPDALATCRKQRAGCPDARPACRYASPAGCLAAERRLRPERACGSRSQIGASAESGAFTGGRFPSAVACGCRSGGMSREGDDTVELAGDVGKLIRLTGVVFNFGRKIAGVIDFAQRAHHGREVHVAFEKRHETALFGARG